MAAVLLELFEAFAHSSVHPGRDQDPVESRENDSARPHPLDGSYNLEEAPAQKTSGNRRLHDLRDGPGTVAQGHGCITRHNLTTRVAGPEGFGQRRHGVAVEPLTLAEVADRRASPVIVEHDAARRVQDADPASPSAHDDVSVLESGSSELLVVAT